MNGTDIRHKPIFPLKQLLIVCIGMLVCASAYAAEWALPELMQLLAQQKSARAIFTEKKYIAILDKPLESSGELSFDAPGRLEKRTLKPRPETMLLDGDKLTITLHENQVHHLSLQDHPEVAAVVESIRGTLNGDQLALEKNYRLAFTGMRSKWQLTLTPVQKSVAKILRQIHIGGTGANIKTITFEQADGDRSEMAISKVASP